MFARSSASGAVVGAGATVYLLGYGSSMLSLRWYRGNKSVTGVTGSVHQFSVGSIDRGILFATSTKRVSMFASFRVPGPVLGWSWATVCVMFGVYGRCTDVQSICSRQPEFIVTSSGYDRENRGCEHRFLVVMATFYGSGCQY